MRNGTKVNVSGEDLAFVDNNVTFLIAKLGNLLTHFESKKRN